MGVEIEAEVHSGRPRDENIKRAIMPALRELKMANPAAMARKISVTLGHKVCRISAYKYLEELAAEHRIKRHVVSKGAKRTIIVYSL
jgi:hypothetical protein